MGRPAALRCSDIKSHAQTGCSLLTKGFKIPEEREVTLVKKVRRLGAPLRLAFGPLAVRLHGTAATSSMLREWWP